MTQTNQSIKVTKSHHHVATTLFVLSLLALPVLTPQAMGAVLVFDVNLNGFSESPPNASPGVGVAEVDYDNVLHLLTVDMSFSGLLGTTTASHIHAATAVPGTGTAGVATTTPYFSGFPIGVTSGTYSNTLDLTLTSSYNPAYITANGGTTAGAESALAAAMVAGEAYLNIHTTVVPGGEIRGFLVQVPEPSSMILTGLGVMGLAWTTRRRSRA
jgi:hypothetical protein